VMYGCRLSNSVPARGGCRMIGVRGLELSGIGGKRGIDLPCYKKPNEYRWDEGGGRRRRRRRRRNLTTPT